VIVRKGVIVEIAFWAMMPTTLLVYTIGRLLRKRSSTLGILLRAVAFAMVIAIIVLAIIIDFA